MFVEFLKEMNKEKTLDEKIIFIDRLIASTFSKKTYLYYRDIIKEIERLNNIIKEVREYIETLNEYGIGKNAKKELLEILDKESK